MSHEPTQEEFLKDVANHKMTVLLDNGVYRHIRFKNPECISQYFELITAPGVLLYRGDMGCYEFERSNDMFEFFRNQNINPRYWGEKLQAVSIFGSGYKEFSESLFKAAIEDNVKLFLESNGSVAEAHFRERVEEEILVYSDNASLAMHTAMNFSHNGKLVFPGFYENDFSVHTVHYIWACRAIVWGISQYDLGRGDVNLAHDK